jgi:hypothetical protein
MRPAPRPTSNDTSLHSQQTVTRSPDQPQSVQHRLMIPTSPSTLPVSGLALTQCRPTDRILLMTMKNKGASGCRPVCLSLPSQTTPAYPLSYMISLAEITPSSSNNSNLSDLAGNDTKAAADQLPAKRQVLDGEQNGRQGMPLPVAVALLVATSPPSPRTTLLILFPYRRIRRVLTDSSQPDTISSSGSNDINIFNQSHTSGKWIRVIFFVLI